MGHYLVSRRHHLDVTLPYFIPAPPIPFIIGTFGAFIRIRSPIRDKRALLDVGCAGPLIGVLVAIPVILLGLKLSTVTVIGGGEETVTLGEPLLFKFLSWLALGPMTPEQNVILHPVAFAGWIGLLVTALNLIPVGQLDGGHVAYALFPEYHRYISLGMLGLLVVCGVVFWQGWLLWAVLLVFLGWRHPPPYQFWVPLDRRRRVLGIITIVVFGLTFCAGALCCGVASITPEDEPTPSSNPALKSSRFKVQGSKLRAGTSGTFHNLRVGQRPMNDWWFEGKNPCWTYKIAPPISSAPSAAGGWKSA